MNQTFYKGKSVFVTGHTGFKGAWLCQILKQIGANVTGYALAPEPGSLFEIVAGEKDMDSFTGDIRNYDKLYGVFKAAQPEIVLHLAAQPLVLDSYKRPVYTFDTNLMGTINFLECLRQSNSVRSAVIVTTDKVYRNIESTRGYTETDILGGNDPYSASKACAELAAESYKASFLKSLGISLSTARAGNVIGGGDISENRIIPDCIKAAVAGKPISVRNPTTVRPYQHVLEPLAAYLLIAQRQWDDLSVAGNYNIGPDWDGCVSTEELATIFCGKWGNDQKWESVAQHNAPPEAGLLYLDCEKIYSVLGWRPVWDVEKAVEKTVEWEKARVSGKCLAQMMNKQISEYMEDIKNG